MSIITRFAPSPTGFLHIGGARTALFNWLFARHFQGRFLLRIEDTDQNRSTKAAISEIIEGLQWLGLDWDENPIFQSENKNSHTKIANQLLEKGNAYKCFATTKELSEMRTHARAEGRQPVYDGRWRNKGPEEWPSDIQPCIRFKSPKKGTTSIKDEVQGEVKIQNTQLDDMVIVRSDGSPTYLLAAAVDDHEMGITHVIRGDDHLVNAIRQSQLYRALDWVEPVYAHIPLIHGSDGSKLSKRDGALSVSAYQEMGFLPETMQNYLLRLGWSHGDDEIISVEQAIKWFNLESVGKGPAKFDLKKLVSLNSHYLQHISITKAVKIISEGLVEDCGRDLNALELERLLLGSPGLLSRAKTIKELISSAKFYVQHRPIPLDKNAEKLLKINSKEILPKIIESLESIEGWEADDIEAAMRALAIRCNLKLGSIAQPLRAALTGTTVSPSIFEVMKALGQAETMARLADV